MHCARATCGNKSLGCCPFCTITQTLPSPCTLAFTAHVAIRTRPTRRLLICTRRCLCWTCMAPTTRKREEGTVLCGMALIDMRVVVTFRVLRLVLVGHMTIQFLGEGINKQYVSYIYIYMQYIVHVNVLLAFVDVHFRWLFVPKNV